ncbi:MAG: ABC transporter permease [Hyphomonas sp.]|nr:ABC transporter permease [Hyphomonas sp.]
MSDNNAVESTQNWRGLRGLISGGTETVGILFAFYIVLVVAFSVLSPYFLTFNNISNIVANMAFIGIMAAALTPLIIAGGLDLSSPAIAGLSGVVLGMLVAHGLDIWVAAGLALVVGSAIGFVNGLIIEKIGVNPFIATLGMLSIVEGGALVLTGGLTRPLIDPVFNMLGSGRVMGFPIIALFMIAVFVIVGYVMTQTRSGRYIFACGGNPEAAEIAGVPVERLRIALYTFSGFCGALAGLLLAARLGATAPTAASASLLTVIAAVILGGTSLLGGRGFILGTLIAVMILGTLNNALVILGVSSFWQKVTHGVVLLLAVGIDQIREKRRRT